MAMAVDDSSPAVATAGHAAPGPTAPHRPTPPDLPNWAWDVIADLVQYEAEHGADWPCLEQVLLRAPREVWDAAAVVSAYRRRAHPEDGAAWWYGPDRTREAP